MTRRLLLLAGLGLVLAACGRGTKHDVVRKADGANSRAELEKVLGKPDGFESAGVGPLRMETWVYRASDGEVLFVIAGDTIVSRSTR